MSFTNPTKKKYRRVLNLEILVVNALMRHHLQSMRNNLRQLPDLTFSRTLVGILRGWDLTIERNEELHL